jgi:predicted PurR-regulated permease PerM
MYGRGLAARATEERMKSDLRINWLIAIGLTGWLMYLLAPILTPFVAAALLAYVGDPLADRLQKLKLPRTLAVVAVFLLTFLTLGLLILLIVPLIRNQIGALLSALPAIGAQVEQVWLPWAAQFLDIDLGDDVGIGPFLARYSEMAGNWGGKVLLGVAESGGALATAVISLFLVPILTFYMLRDWDLIVARGGALVPLSQRDTIFGLVRDADEMLGAFLRGQLLVMMALAVIYSVGLSFVLLATFTVVLEPDPLWRLVGVFATFTIAQLIEGSVLTPKLVGDRIGLHPVLVIFSVAAGGQLFGFFGILLALPAAAVLSVVVRYAYKTYLEEHPQEAEELREATADAGHPDAGDGESS